MATGAKEKGQAEHSRNGMCRWGLLGARWVRESKGTRPVEALNGSGHLPGERGLTPVKAVSES